MGQGRNRYFALLRNGRVVLMRGSASARLLGLRVRIPPTALMSVSCECYVLSGRGLCEVLIACAEEYCRVWLCVLSGRGLYDVPIACAEEYYRVWLCVLSGRGLYDVPIACAEEYYRVWSCVLSGRGLCDVLIPCPEEYYRSCKSRQWGSLGALQAVEPRQKEEIYEAGLVFCNVLSWQLMELVFHSAAR